jgi:hypothetical protein
VRAKGVKVDAFNAGSLIIFIRRSSQTNAEPSPSDQRHQRLIGAFWRFAKLMSSGFDASYSLPLCMQND